MKEVYAWMHTTDSRVTTLEAHIESMQAELDTLRASNTTVQNNNTHQMQASQEPSLLVNPDDATSTIGVVTSLDTEPVSVATTTESVLNTDATNEVPVVPVDTITTGP
jgi:hypothetical protein